MSSQSPNSVNHCLYDEKQRKVILKESLIGYHESSITSGQIGSTSQDDSWTQHGWHKEGSAQVPSRRGKGKTGRNQMQQVKQPNKLQRKLEEALAKPVQMSKAESMMQKMGWQGGALGKTGTGIVEPVAPNAAYAIKTRGFGQASHTPDPPPPKKTKTIKTYKPKKSRQIFLTKVLLEILEFVKNDYESEIAFDRRLFQKERKLIHHLVNDVISGDDVASLGSLAQMDIVKKIQAHNKYVLCTESQGVHRYRYLCLFKEAPEHVFLITPKDLRDETEDADESDEKTEENSSKNQNNKSQSLDEAVNKKELTATSISSEPEKGIANLHENVNEERKDTNSSNQSKKEIVSKDENLDKEIINTDSSDQPTEEISILDEHVIEKLGDKKSSNDLLKESEILDTPVNIELTHTCTSNNILKEVNLDANVNKKFKDSSNFNEPLKKDANVEEELTDSNNSNSKDDKESEEIPNLDVTGKILEYFREFADSEDYSELRFLGPFTWEEMDRINNLVSNVYYHLHHNEDKVDKLFDEVLKGLNEERFSFEVTEDINGNPVIHKTDLHKGKRMNTKNHLFFETEDL